MPNATRLRHGMRCFNCNGKDCLAIKSSIRCARPTFCYCCQEHAGHIARNCPQFYMDPCLQDVDWLRPFAAKYGWNPRDARGAIDGWNPENKTLFLINENNVRIDIYPTTATIKTIMNHPSRGRNQLFRTGYWSKGKLRTILCDPRVHTGLGYRTERGGKYPCKVCQNWKKRTQYSRNQWRKKRRVPLRPTCKPCQQRRGLNAMVA